MEVSNVKAKKRRLKPQEEDVEMDEEEDGQGVEEAEPKDKKKRRRRHKSAKHRLRFETDHDSGVGLEVASTSIAEQKTQENEPVIEDTALLIPEEKKRKKRWGKSKLREARLHDGDDNPNENSDRAFQDIQPLPGRQAMLVIQSTKNTGCNEIAEGA